MRSRGTIRARRRGGAAGFVAVLPGQGTAGTPALAAALGRDVYGARQLLLRGSPAVVAFADLDEAQAAAARAVGAGVRCVAFAQADVDAVLDAREVVQLAMRGVDMDGGPYRSGPAAELEAITDDGALEPLALGSVALVVVGRLSTERVETIVREEVVPSRARPGPEPRTRVERVREREARAIIDLHLRGGAAPLRLVEGTTTIRGAGLRDFEHAAAFIRLQRWLERTELGLAIDAGWAREAPRHEEIERTEHGELRDSSGGWDEWSARAIVIWRLARR